MNKQSRLAPAADLGCSPVPGSAATNSNSNRRAVDAATIAPGKPNAVGRGLGKQNATATPSPADAHYLAVQAELIAEGYGLGPRCVTCRRNVSGCVCNYPDPEPQYFRPGTVRDIDSMVDWRRL